jgi:hypothetical protein
VELVNGAFCQYYYVIVPVKKAVSEIGFFGNQNTVCKPTTKKWERTINRLKELWGVD